MTSPADLQPLPAPPYSAICARDGYDDLLATVTAQCVDLTKQLDASRLVNAALQRQLDTLLGHVRGIVAAGAPG